MKMARHQSFLLASGAYCLAFLVALNLLHSPHPWVLYCLPAFLLMPLAIGAPRKLGNKAVSIFISAAVILYYVLLNLLLSPGHPWAVYVIFPVLWYPFSLRLGRKPFAFSVFGLIWSILFFGAVNIITTPGEIWAVYPVFFVAWWPLSVFFFVERKKRACT